jgi:hypothetical protein
MKINRRTNIPVTACEKINMRVTEATKKAIRNLAKKQKKSMSKVVLKMIDYYIINAVTSDFWVTHNKVSEKIKRISHHEAQKF